MAARISYADLSDATGISTELLAAEATAIQRSSSLGEHPAPRDEAPAAPAPAAARAEERVPEQVAA